MHLRIQLPVLNEARTVLDVIRSALASAERVASRVSEPRVSVLAIDDGSTDGSTEVLRALASRDPRVGVLRHEYNRGLGYSFFEGVREARRDAVDVLVNVDADAQFDAAYLEVLVEPILRGEADLVTGSRALEIAPDPPMSLLSRAGNHALARVISVMIGREISDASCGFRAFSRRAVMSLEIRSRFTHTHESLLVCAQKGLHIREVAVPVKGTRPHGRSAISGNPLRYGLECGRAILATWWQQ